MSAFLKKYFTTLFEHLKYKSGVNIFQIGDSKTTYLTAWFWGVK